MTKDEAMRMALEALETERENYQDWDKKDGAPEYIHEAITALREARAEKPVQQEPVDEQAIFEDWLARNCPSGDVDSVHRQWEASGEYADLYTSLPAQRTWVGLTDEEVWDLWNSHTEEPFPEWFVDFKRAYKVIEAKLLENT